MPIDPPIYFYPTVSIALVSFSIGMLALVGLVIAYAWQDFAANKKPKKK